MNQRKLSVSRNFIGLVSTFLATYFASLLMPMGDTHFIGCVLVALIGWSIPMWFLHVKGKAFIDSLEIVCGTTTALLLFIFGPLLKPGLFGNVLSFITIIFSIVFGPLLVLIVLNTIGKYIEISDQ